MSDNDDDGSSSNSDDAGSDAGGATGSGAGAAAAAETYLKEPEENTLRVMLSTDNHLGYNERDPVRGMDSFAAFEEVLYLSKRYKCDMVLIAGDLFHDNRPSRRTLHKTMEIFRRYTMGPDPVRIQILSDQSKNFRNAVTGCVNYQDESYSVDLPIFSIHGNHDDPSRDAGGGELLAALDLLAVSNLVNYFGRQDQVDKVEVSPVLVQKGTTKVALYGMGSMRDERLNRMWADKKVKFLRPEEDDRRGANGNGGDDEADAEDAGGFFNLFALHQNRDLGRGSKNCVQESMIPDWMDVVVWGHEHECLIEFFESVVGTFRITQPGSSVATSLVAGEAVKKQVGVLDINGKNFRLHPVPLTQVRGFVTSELSLKEHKADLDPEDHKIDSKITAILNEEVQLLVLNARDRIKETLEDAKAAGNDAGDEGSPLKYKLARPDEVLVRIRVEHSGFTTLNNQRFGARFVGDVANPTDILLFHRRKDIKPTAGQSKKRSSALKTPIIPEELEKTNMEDLVLEFLEAPNQKLQILDKNKLSDALDEYVEKNSTSIIADTTQALIKAAQKKCFARARNDDTLEKATQIREMVELESQVHEETKKKKSSKKRKSKNSEKEEHGNDEDEDEEMEETGKENSFDEDQSSAKPSTSSRRTAARAAPTDAKRKAARRQHDSDDEDDDDEVQVMERSSSKSQVSRSTKSSKSRSSAGQAARRQKATADASDEDEVEVLDISQVSQHPRTKKSSRAPAARPKRTTTKRPATYSLDDGDDDFDDDSDAFVANGNDNNDEDDFLEVDDEEPPAKKKRATKRAPAAAAKKTTLSGRARSSATKSTADKSKRGRNTSRLDSDSDDDVNDNDGDGHHSGSAIDLDDDWGTANTRSQY